MIAPFPAPQSVNNSHARSKTWRPFPSSDAGTATPWCMVKNWWTVIRRRWFQHSSANTPWTVESFQRSVAVDGSIACQLWATVAALLALGSRKGSGAQHPAHFCAASWLPVVEEASSIDGPERFAGSSHSGRTAKDGEKFPTSKSKACFMLPHFLRGIIALLCHLKDDLEATNSTAHGFRG
jgi:hypothetical protein